MGGVAGTEGEMAFCADCRIAIAIIIFVPSKGTFKCVRDLRHTELLIHFGNLHRDRKRSMFHKRCPPYKTYKYAYPVVINNEYCR